MFDTLTIRAEIRRSAFIRPSGFVVAAAMTLAYASTVAAQPATTYVLTDLGTLGGTQSFARSINNEGQVTGNSRSATNQLHAYVWQDGVMVDLGTLPGHTFSRGYHVSHTGTVVGESDNNQSQAFLYSDGVMINIGNLGRGTAVAHGVNAREQVVGGSSTDEGLRAFLYEDGFMRSARADLFNGSPPPPGRRSGASTRRRPRAAVPARSRPTSRHPRAPAAAPPACGRPRPAADRHGLCDSR